MSELNSTIEFLESSEINNPPTDSYVPPKDTDKESIDGENIKYFDIREFGQELYKKSESKNRAKALRKNQNITGYDIAHNCIMHVLYKLRNTPIQNYADSWLPIFMRTEVGTAVHNFIQKNTNQFTETEVNLKVPSIGFYGKIDYMIGNNVLGEIKTCTYEDYARILKQQKPREKDFLQTFAYHYFLHNHLEESKSVKLPFANDEPPKLDHYDVTKFQFIYVSHDLISSQAESYTDMLEKIRSLKKMLDSRRNPFFFITSVVVDLDKKTIEKFHNFVKTKIDDIHHYMNTNTNPTADSRFVNTKACFFCPYKLICQLCKNN